MNAKSIFCAAVAAIGMTTFGATESHAQSLLNPLTWFTPPPAYRPAAAPCATGQCPTAPAYRPVANAPYYAQPVANSQYYVAPVSNVNCPNGNCSLQTGGAVNCVNGQCYQAGNCPGGICPVNGSAPYTNTTNYAPMPVNYGPVPTNYGPAPIGGSPYYTNQFNSTSNYTPVINRPIPNYSTGSAFPNNQYQNPGFIPAQPNYAPNYSPNWNTGYDSNQYNQAPNYVPPFRGRAAGAFDGDLR
jgi:hypothetical protein